MSEAAIPNRTGVEVRDLVKTYPGQAAPAVDGVSFPVPDMLALLGPSGCGKTTILRMIAVHTYPAYLSGFISWRDEASAAQVSAPARVRPAT